MTFFGLPAGVSELDLFNNLGPLLDHDHVTAHYSVDSYLVGLHEVPANLVDQSAYWYSVWSHRRDHTWKGFVQLELGDDNADALKLLSGLPSEEGVA